jgi:hypothetical protein
MKKIIIRPGVAGPSKPCLASDPIKKSPTRGPLIFLSLTGRTIRHPP